MLRVEKEKVSNRSGYAREGSSYFGLRILVHYLGR